MKKITSEQENEIKLNQDLIKELEYSRSQSELQEQQLRDKLHSKKAKYKNAFEEQNNLLAQVLPKLFKIMNLT